MKLVPKGHWGFTMRTGMQPWSVATIFQWLAFTQLLQGAEVTLLCKFFFSAARGDSHVIKL